MNNGHPIATLERNYTMYAGPQLQPNGSKSGARRRSRPVLALSETKISLLRWGSLAVWTHALTVCACVWVCVCVGGGGGVTSFPRP